MLHCSATHSSNRAASLPPCRTEPKRLAVARQMDQEDTEEQQPQTDQRGKEDGKKRKPTGKGKVNIDSIRFTSKAYSKKV